MTYGINSRADVRIETHVVPSSHKRQILCATDLSEGSEHAVHRALLLARQLDARLLLLHVVDDRQLVQVIGLQADRARSVLQHQSRQFSSIDKPGAEISVRVGKPHQTIVSVAKEWDADLVILGAYRKRTGDRFLGTTAERVVRAATRPVLIVNGEAATVYHSVLLASDLSDEYAQVAHMTQQLGLLEGARVSVVHALEPARASALYTAGVTEPYIARYLRSLRQASRETLREQMHTAGLASSHVYVTQEHARPFRAIERAVVDTSPQLLVVGMSRYAALKRLLSGSIANEVLRKIECDVLIASPAAVQHVRSTIDGRMRQDDAVKTATATLLNETETTA